MIELRNISKKYDTFELKDISLSINKGEYLVILGPSGAGKTVILEIIAGLEKADIGEVIKKINIKWALFTKITCFFRICQFLIILDTD